MRLINHPVSRIVQHLAFWVLSFVVFAQLFKTGNTAEKIDYIYTALFHLFLAPAVYINLRWLPRVKHWPLYGAGVCVLIALFSWLNYSFFQSWSKYVLPDYFFISYFSWWEISLFFLVYIGISSLLKLSKSWFAVNELKSELVQTELRALKAQVNPHFFFNTLNGIYSLALEKDERLPDMVLRLSHLMRYFLYEAKEDTVPLEKEWKVLQDYIALQQIRSDESLHVEKTVEGEIEQQRIAPLLLITFLENAFKHGAKGNIGDAYIKLLVKVQDKNFTFKVANTKGKVDEIGSGDYGGVGLQNVRRLLQLLYPGRHTLTIDDEPHEFAITLQLQL
jgi:sensor histidine kinase YesM